MTIAIVVLCALQVFLIVGVGNISMNLQRQVAELRTGLVDPPTELNPAQLPPIEIGDLVNCSTCYGSGFHHPSGESRVCWKCNGARKVPALAAKTPNPEPTP